MLSDKNRQDLIEKIKGLKKELSNLKPKLYELNNLKEAEFKKKESLKKEINSLIKQLREIKGSKDKSYNSIKSLKSQRDKYNSEVKNLIKNIKELNTKKREAFEKSDIKTDPSLIQSKIEEIEKRLEIEVSFENEKKLMKEIKKLKKVYEESAEIKNLLENISKLSKDITTSKQKADVFHKKIKEYSQQTKTGFNDFIDLSKKINDLRKKEEEAFKRFIEHKKQFIELNKSFKDKMGGINVIQQHLDDDIKDKRKEKEETNKATLLEKTKEVFEKLKNKKKLTTEDLLIFQQK